MRNEGIDVRVVKLDVNRQADIDAAAAMVESEFGRLDVLVNNAGVMIEKGWTEKPTSETTIENLRATFEANLFPSWRDQGAAAGAEEGRRRADRECVQHPGLGEPAGDQGLADIQHQAVCIQRIQGGAECVTISLAHELRHTKIKVNSAHPGWVKTDLGGSAAPMNVVDGAKTEVELATLGEDGPGGGFFHMGEEIPW